MTLIDCFGSGLARGRAHGETARPLVRNAIEHWEHATLAASTGAKDILTYASGFVSSTGLLAQATKLMPDLVDELHGIAQGAGVPFEVVAAYNFMDEQWWYDLPAPPPWEPGCSVLGYARGHTTVLAQHMDLPAFMDGSQVVLRIGGEGLPETLLLSAAGLIGLTGVNRAGVGVCVNTLLMLRHQRNGVPVAFAVRHALAQPSAAQAEAALGALPHASGQHYAVADRQGMYSQECSAGGCVPSAAGNGPLIHTNHPLYSDDVDGHPLAILEAAGRVQNSQQRLACLDASLPQLHSADDVQQLLGRADTPLAIKPGPKTRTQTFGSVLFELGDQPRAAFCLGQPGTQAWQDVAFTA